MDNFNLIRTNDSEIEISLSSSSTSSSSSSPSSSPPPSSPNVSHNVSHDLSSALSLKTPMLIEDEDDIKNSKPLCTKGELLLDDLPPIENLNIKLSVEELSQIGSVQNILDRLVIVQSFKGKPALDLESYLFFKDGSPLGSIFDVFGPVIEPRYAIRFNNNEEIIEKAIEPDMPVYYAEFQDKPLTSYVLVAQLRETKGSDASWEHNNEPPEDVKEYSDDEEEKNAKVRNRIYKLK